jgi:bacteriorhodopsin
MQLFEQDPIPIPQPPNPQLPMGLSVLHWTFFCFSFSAALLFAVMCAQSKSTNNLVPVVNLFVAVVMTMTYFALATLDQHLIQPTLFIEMIFNLPLLYLQTLLLTGAPLQHIFLVIGFQELHAVTIFVFTQVGFPYAWVWFVFGIIFWVATAIILLGPIQARAYQLSARVYGIFLAASIALLFAQVLYPMILLLLYLQRISMFFFFVILGVLDFFTRIALGVYFALNVDAFGDIKLTIARSTCPSEEEAALLAPATNEREP